MTASTYGTGVLIAEAARLGARRILVACGGSATTDGGAGAIAAIEERGGLRGADVVVLSDVTTRFADAARVFGPQKGAGPAAVELLTARLEQQALAFLRDHGRDPRTVDRTGAAGGFSGGLWARYGAALVSGADYVLDLLDFDGHLAGCSAVVVGEGRLDSQTGQGKIIAAILARSGTTPVYAVVGSVHEDLGDYAEQLRRRDRGERRGRDDTCGCGGRRGLPGEHDGTCPPLAASTGHSPNMPTRGAKDWTCPQGSGRRNGHVPPACAGRIPASLSTRGTCPPLAASTGHSPNMPTRGPRTGHVPMALQGWAAPGTGHVPRARSTRGRAPLNHFGGRLPQGAGRRLMGLVRCRETSSVERSGEPLLQGISLFMHLVTHMTDLSRGILGISRG